MDAILEQYNQQGYITISNFFTGNELETMTCEVNQVQQLPAVPGTDYMHYYEKHTVTDEQLLCRTENFLIVYRSLNR